jgi:hypothetical protein
MYQYEQPVYGDEMDAYYDEEYGESMDPQQMQQYY